LEKGLDSDTDSEASQDIQADAASLDLVQLNSTEPQIFGTQDTFKEAMQYLDSFKKYTSPDLIPEKEVPKSHDLRNIKGVDFTSKQRDQGGCGSCYTLGFIYVVEQRLR